MMNLIQILAVVVLGTSLSGAERHVARVQDPDGVTEPCGQPRRPELPGFAHYHDAKRQFCPAYGRHAGGLPDPARVYIG